MVNITLNDDGVLNYNEEKYAAWPDFRPLNLRKIGTIYDERHLKEVLTRDDLSCGAWRQAIPTPVLRELVRYNYGLCELIAFAQINPEAFVRLSQCNPALAHAASRSWEFSKCQFRPRPPQKEVFERFRHAGTTGIVALLGYPNPRQTARILAKIKAEDCQDYMFMVVLHLCEDPTKRRYLRHLPRINGSVTALLGNEPAVLDAGVLRLAALAEEEALQWQIQTLVFNIKNYREMAGLKPLWPYHNTIGTFDQLVSAERKAALRVRLEPEFFPEAPLPDIGRTVPEGLKLTALRSYGQLQMEARAMENCAEAFIESIHRNQAYLYRMKAPERATLLIVMDHGRWVLSEAKTKANEADVSRETHALLMTWIQQSQ